MDLYSWILTSAIAAGQLVKIPISGGRTGPTLLDLTIISLNLIGLWKLKFKLKTPPTFIKAGLCFILIAVLSLIFTPLKLNLNQYFISFSYTIRFFSFILFGWIILSGAFDDLKKNIFPILTFSGIILSILGLLQFIFLPDLMFLQQFGWDPHYFRTVSTFFDPSFIGGYFVLTLILLIQKQIKVIQRLNLIFFALVYLVLLTTFSRGAYLMFGVSFASLALMRRSLKLLILTILLSLGLFLGYSGYKNGVSQPRNIDRAQSAQFRLNSWQRGLIIFTQSPVLGVGYNTYPYALKEFNLASPNLIATRGGTSNDSSLMQALSTTGVIGFISFIMFLITLIWSERLNFIKPNSPRIILTSALLGLIVHSFFANSLFYPFLLLWLILAAVKIN